MSLMDHLLLNAFLILATLVAAKFLKPKKDLFLVCSNLITHYVDFLHAYKIRILASTFKLKKHFRHWTEVGLTSFPSGGFIA